MWRTVVGAWARATVEKRHRLSAAVINIFIALSIISDGTDRQGIT
jgi:hypothetical protein